MVTRLRAEHGETEFRTWIMPLRLERADNELVLVEAPTRAVAGQGMDRYLARIRALVAEARPDLGQVVIQVSGREAA